MKYKYVSIIKYQRKPKFSYKKSCFWQIYVQLYGLNILCIYSLAFWTLVWSLYKDNLTSLMKLFKSKCNIKVSCNIKYQGKKSWVWQMPSCAGKTFCESGLCFLVLSKENLTLLMKLKSKWGTNVSYIIKYQRKLIFRYKKNHGFDKSMPSCAGQTFCASVLW